MRAVQNAGRWAASFVFAVLASSAGAPSSNDASPLWIESQSFGFEACAARIAGIPLGCATAQAAIVALADQMTRSLRGVVIQASLR